MLSSPLLGDRESGREKVAASRISLFLIFSATVLFIVPLATASLISTAGFGPIKTSSLNADIGPFRACYHIGDDGSCNTIDNDCEFNVASLGFGSGDNVGSLDISVPVVDDCRTFNVARIFLLLGALLSAACFLVQLFYVCIVGAPHRNAISHGIIVALSALTVVCGIVSMAIFIRLKDNDDAFQVANMVKYAYGFYLVCTAWPLVFLSMLPYINVK